MYNFIGKYRQKVKTFLEEKWKIIYNGVLPNPNKGGSCNGTYPKWENKQG